jgi:dimethylhistidine N-methyltransferase
VYRIVDLPRVRQDALAEVLAGLAREPRELPSKYFYDEVGSELFERICELPEYYLTRAELQLMERHAASIAAFVGPHCRLIEFGCGSGRKTRMLLARLRPAEFIPVDISRRALEQACGALAGEFASLPITALCGDYTNPIDFPFSAASGRRAVYFPGSTVGNFSRADTVAFLARIADIVGPGGALVIGVDLKKSPARLHAAYNDARGVTARFNLNLLSHLNRRFAADFDPGAFEHVAFYDEALGRIEMQLRSRLAQTVSIGGRRFAFAAGEPIRTEISCKYSLVEFQELGRNAGFDPIRFWLDDAELFSVHGFVARSGR